MTNWIAKFDRSGMRASKISRNFNREWRCTHTHTHSRLLYKALRDSLATRSKSSKRMENIEVYGREEG
jgi:hypothetical protein